MREEDNAAALKCRASQCVWRLRIGRRSKICEFQTQVPGIGGVAESGVQIDGSYANEFFNFTIEVLHSLVVSNSHGVKQGLAFGFTFFHVLTRA